MKKMVMPFLKLWFLIFLPVCIFLNLTGLINNDYFYYGWLVFCFVLGGCVFKIFPVKEDN